MYRRTHVLIRTVRARICHAAGGALVGRESHVQVFCCMLSLSQMSGDCGEMQPRGGSVGGVCRRRRVVQRRKRSGLSLGGCARVEAG